MNARDELRQALVLADAEYDEQVGLLCGVVGPTRYHTRLEPGTAIHPTRESMVYAAALLESGEPWRRDRALGILDLLLPLQQNDPCHPACGVWPWYWEEPLDQMAPPDGNWADFLGVQLVRILRNEPSFQATCPALKKSLRLAAEAIRKRNVRLSYTNIAIMGIYVCVMAGRILGEEALLSYGRKRLRDFVRFSRQAGGFPEYNSPTYTVVSLVELTRMLRDFSDDEDIVLVREVHDMAWREIALHWHAPSRQWAGPHSRSYSTLLQSETLGFLQRGLAGTVSLLDGDPPPSLDWCALPIQCPADLGEKFTELQPRFHHVEIIAQGVPPLEARSHHEPEFVLSSAERGTFWNQSRPLVAYAPSAKGPVALAVRFLHDGYDFCAANLLSRQTGSRVLAAVCFAQDGGDRHGELDRFPDGRIEGEDWRLRFELTDCEAVPAIGFSRPWVLPFGGSAVLTVHWLQGRFGGDEPRLEVLPNEKGVCLDVVFYRGRRKVFLLDGSVPAGAAFGLEIHPAGRFKAGGRGPRISTEPRTLELRWSASLRLDAPRFPLPEANILTFARHSKTELASFAKLLEN